MKKPCGHTAPRCSTGNPMETSKEDKPVRIPKAPPNEDREGIPPDPVITIWLALLPFALLFFAFCLHGCPR